MYVFHQTYFLLHDAKYLLDIYFPYYTVFWAIYFASPESLLVMYYYMIHIPLFHMQF